MTGEAGAFPSSEIDIYHDYADMLHGSALVRAVPEPSTLALLGFGAISLLAYARRRRARTA